MASVGNVRIGSKNIDIRAFTGHGQHSIEVSERVISVSRGQTVTRFWGVVRGKDRDWLTAVRMEA